MLLDELRAALVELGEQRYRADQIFRWVHGRGATSVEEMTDLSRGTRERLAGLLDLEPLVVEADLHSQDGTRKLRLRASDGSRVESVLIPDGAKLTLCVSTQVGCALGCRFCATGTLGLRRNLLAGEIVDQVYRARALVEGRITHLVFMGMGEPLLNYEATLRAIRLLTHDLGAGFSTRRITVSTAGVVPGIERLGKEEIQVNLAVSLNATTDEVRSDLMPINRRYPLGELLAAIRAFPLPRRRRVTFEYVLLQGVNDTPEDARRLVGLLRGIPAKVNLIPWNPHGNIAFRRPSAERVLRFQEILKERGVGAYLRETRGDDIAAACGQLVASGGLPERHQ